MNRTAKTYLRRISRAIPVRGMRKSTLDSLRESVLEYGERCPQAKLEAYYEKFGEPRQVAENALENTPAATLYRTLNRSRFIWCLALGTVVFIITVFSVAMTIIVSDIWDDTHGYGIEEDAIIISRTEDLDE